MLSENKHIKRICFTMFCCFALLSYFFPYTGDDWSWGSSIGIDRLRIFFAGYNGRYAGNLIVLLLTRSKLLDVLVMAIAFTLVCFFPYKYTDEKSVASLMLAGSLFLLMPKGMWAQVVVWTAGFTNYVLSALISVAYLISIKEMTGKELSASNDAFGKNLLWFVMSFCGALFVENVTVFNICIAFAAIVCKFLRFRRCSRRDFAFLLGSVAGACLMFSNGAYSRIAQGEDYYRTTPGSFRDTVYFALGQARIMLNYILSDNFPFCAVVTVLLLALAVRSIQTGSRKRWAIIPAVLHGCSLLSLCCEDAVSIMLSRLVLPKLLANLLPLVIPLLYVLSVFVMVLCFVEKGQRFGMLLPLYCTVASLAPLLVVTPVGSRCLFIGYFFMMVFTVDLFGYIRKQIFPDEKVLSHVIGWIAAVQLLFFINIYWPIHYYDALRLDYIKEQIKEEKDIILVSDLPNSDYLWADTPKSDSWMEKYYLFYDLDPDLPFEIITHEHLQNLIKNESSN